MFYALVYYPELNDKVIDTLRKQYDPYSDLIQEHITLIFPVPDTIGEENLMNHVTEILKNKEPFRIHIVGFEKTWDNWLFLKVKEGKERLMNLYDSLYTGILQLYLRKDLPYIPHVGVGLFTKERYDPLQPEKLTFDKDNYEKAVEQLKKQNPEYWRIMNQLSLIRINDDFSHLEEIKTYYIG